MALEMGRPSGSNRRALERRPVYSNDQAYAGQACRLAPGMLGIRSIVFGHTPGWNSNRHYNSGTITAASNGNRRDLERERLYDKSSHAGISRFAWNPADNRHQPADR